MPLLGDRYRLLDRLGRGGTSVVWKAYDQVLRRTVAVKLLTGQAGSAAARELALAEARTVAQLSHPHICQVHDYGETRTESGEQVPYIVMELLSGATLHERLREGPIPMMVALRICAQMASALASAHSCGLVHRDVKPGNVILTPAGAKVVDFGIAATVGTPDEASSDGEIWGTPAYLAPERLLEGKVTPASDVYALGLVLYRVVSGVAPWPAETVTEMFDAHRYEDPAPLPLRDGLPESIADLCERCLAKDPGDRPTADQVARRLAEAVGWRMSQPGYRLVEVGDGVRQPDRLALAPEARPIKREAVAAEPAAPPGEAEAGSAECDPRPPAATDGDDDDYASERSYRRVLLVVAAVAAVLAVAGTLWTAGGPTDGRPGVADAVAESSTGSPASHTAGGGPTLSEGGASVGPNESTGTDPRGSGSGDTADDGSASPGAAAPEPGPGVSGTPEVPDPDPTQPDPDPTQPDSGDNQEVTETAGGTVLARCDRSTASIEALELAPGYRVVDETRGPGVVRAGIVLGSAEQEVRVNVKCQAGKPITTVTSEEVEDQG